ncbi:MAG: glycosyltransferase family 2 protein [Pseudomonadota bacterium]
MKLIVQMPALREEETLATVIRSIPRDIPGISSVEILVIVDGPTDRTVEVAKEAGADHVLRMARNVGPSRAFIAGIEEALSLGADILVKTDADNQYCADDILALIKAVLDRQAQIVEVAGPIAKIESVSPLKKALQRLGSWGVRQAGGDRVGRIQSLILALELLAASVVSLAVSVFGDLISANRSLMEDFRARDLLRAPRNRSDAVPFRFAEFAHVS